MQRITKYASKMEIERVTAQIKQAKKLADKKDVAYRFGNQLARNAVDVAFNKLEELKVARDAAQDAENQVESDRLWDEIVALEEEMYNMDATIRTEVEAMVGSA